MVKKLFAFALALSISFWALAPAASAQTVEELQAQINALLEQLATLQSQLAGMGGGTGTVTGCTITSFDRNLSQGMSGDDVKCLQIVLNSMTETKLADSGAGSPGNETTYFGPITKAAAIKFQEKYASEVLAPWGLTSGTGYIGSTSRAKLNEFLTGGGVTPPDGGGVVTGGFSVALAADNPEAGTIVADSTTGDGAQALIPALKLKFSNGNSSDIDVTEIKFERGGISADADISQAYLYDEDDNKIAEYSAFNDGVLTFSKSAGLFEVEAGKTKTITLKFDLTSNTNSGKTIYFEVTSADYITSDASEVNGTFPLMGNIMTTAQASDLGKLTVATTTQPSTAVDPQDDYEVFHFSLAGQDQKLEIRKIKLTQMGSVDSDDLANFKLYDGGTHLLTVEEANDDKTVIFDFGDSPLIIEKGVTKQMHVRADINGGTNRTFQFSIQEQLDVEAYDTEYGIYIQPDAHVTGGWVVHKVAASTINTGKLSLSRADDTPSGNVPKDGTNVTLARFDMKATGEDVKITQMTADIYGSINSNGLYQFKIYFDGSQKGSTANIGSGASAGTADGTVTFGNTFIVPADGEFHTLEFVSDIKASSSASFSGGETLTAKVLSTTATGRTSLASVSSVSAAGLQLTVAAGTLTTSVNSAVANWSGVIPMGVAGQTEALVGSFIINGGSGEGADISAIKIVDDGSKGFGNLQNLQVYQGTKASGTKIGDTQSSLATNTSYTFYPSPYISVGANDQVAIYVYADIKTSTTSGQSGYVVLDEVSGTGKVTNTSVDVTANANGQTHYIASAGSLTIAQGDDTPISSNVKGGGTDPVSFAQIKFTAGAAEDMEVLRIGLVSRLNNSAPTSSVYNISLWDGSTQVGSTLSSLSSLARAVFYLNDDPWVVPAGTDKNLMVKAYIPEIDRVNATSAGSVKFDLPTSTTGWLDGVQYRGSQSGNTATSSASTGGIATTSKHMYMYRTNVNPAINGSTPSGSDFPAQYDHVLYLDVTNLGSWTAYLNGVTTTISYTQGTGNATASAERVFKIYKSTDLNTQLASTSIASGGTINGGTLTFALSTAEPIAAGATKTFYVIGDTRDCGATSGSNAGSIIQFYINDGRDFNWDDGFSTAVQTTRTFASPLEGGVLTF